MLALEGSPFIASYEGLNLCLGVVWVFTGCVGKNVGMLSRVEWVWGGGVGGCYRFWKYRYCILLYSVLLITEIRK